MIAISHEVPISMLEWSRAYNDYDYALVHLFETRPKYLEFFRESLTQGRTVLLDNSIFELGVAFDSDQFAGWVDDLKPTEYIVPDVLQNYKATVKNFNEWIDTYSSVGQGSVRIGVVQGKTFDELIECYKYMSEFADKIAIGFDYDVYLGMFPHYNKFASYMLGRRALIGYLMASNIINKDKPHHLLGCSLPQEFSAYQGLDFIQSLDTSNPVVHGLLGDTYKIYGLDTKQSIKLVDLIDFEPTEIQQNLAKYNINKFRDMTHSRYSMVV